MTAQNQAARCPATCAGRECHRVEHHEGEHFDERAGPIGLWWRDDGSWQVRTDGPLPPDYVGPR